MKLSNYTPNNETSGVTYIFSQQTFIVILYEKDAGQAVYTAL
jgi:hypothetical protein